MALQLHAAEYSASGPRADNQDALRLVTPAPALAASKGHLFAIADGVSQCADGGLAARTTLQALALDYYATPETWSVPQALDRLLAAQNRWLRVNGGGEPLLTTLSALILRGRRYTLAHVGDCRVYHLRGGALTRLSQDHVWEPAQMQHVLTRALGLDQHLVVDYREGELAAGDSFLMLSDGVWASLDDRHIAAILLDAGSREAAVRALVRAAHLAGSQDNASALLIHVEALGDAGLADTLGRLYPWPLPPVLKAGQGFEHWRVEQQVSESRQSRLYRVRDEQGQPWLLKTLPIDLANDVAAHQQLLLEEWYLRRVAGSGIPQLAPPGERQHLYYLMREHPGRTLAAILASSGPLPLDDWQALTLSVLRTVGRLHQRNLLHRDIKPENLHLGDDGQWRLLDFGLAWCPGLSEETAAGLPGTPSYIAPEAYAGAAPDARQDLFALGVTLFRALTDQYPYGEIEAFQHPRFGTPATAGRWRPDTPPWLEPILAQALHSDPAQRFETAEQWRLALERAERQPQNLRPAPWLEREPLRVWRTLALGSLILNLILLYVAFKG